jgi:hypothetical protein
MKNDFLKFATAQGLNSMHVEKVLSQSAENVQSSYGYISPTILEERQLNVTQMDVFSRLMMDRVIFLGTEVNDYTANVIQAGDTATFMYDGSKYHLLAVDRLCKTAVTGVSWPSTSSHYVTVTYADGSTENIAIHPTNTAYPASGSGAAVPTKNQTPAFGQTFNVPQVVTDDFGHVTAQNTRTVTIPDTKATQSADGLMSSADKAKLDSMTHIMRRYEVTNPSLTYNSSTGTCVWQIAASSMGGGDPRHAICSLRDSSGNEVIADMAFSQQYITVTFNASATIAAGAYTANIIIPIAA